MAQNVCHSLQSLRLARGTTTDVSAQDLYAYAELPLYGYLKEQQGGILGNDVKWNFTKFLVDKNGEVVKRWVCCVQ